MSDKPKRDRGITPLEYAHTGKGYNARYTREGVTFSQTFLVSKFGSWDAAFDAAKEWHENARHVLPPMDRREFAEIRKANNASGTTGVFRTFEKQKDGRVYFYWAACWCPTKGVKRYRRFYVKKYGEEKAKELAIEARQKAIENLDPQWDREYWGFRGQREQELESQIYRDVFAFEGGQNYQLHLKRERDPNLRRAKIDQFLLEHGDLFCEICGFSFEREYGSIGKGLIEIHHTVPLGQLTEERQTTLDELMCVCSNCHFAIHNGDADANLATLRFIFAAKPQSGHKRKTK